MTIEEAIKWVDDRMCWGRGTFTKNHPPNIDECWEAGDMAIKALKRTRWIPVSKELPKEDGLYFVQLDFNDESGRKYKFTCRWADGWNCVRRREDGVIVREHEMKNVVAWMELPDDYEEGDSE